MSNSLKQWMLYSKNQTCNSNHQKKQINNEPNESKKTSKNNDNDILILDGGISTFLEQLLQNSSHNNNNNSGYFGFQYRSLWSSSLLLNEKGQHDIKIAHEAFYNSGCDIISTVTYQLSYYHCTTCCPHEFNDKKDDKKDYKQKRNDSVQVVEKRGNEVILNFTKEDIDNLLKLGIQLANEVRMERRIKLQDSSSTCSSNRDSYVVVSLGCFGACLADGSEYRGNYGKTLQELIVFHERRFQTIMKLQQSDKHNLQVDGIAFETVPCSLEVKAIIQVLKSWKEEQIRMNNGETYEYDDQVAIWISLACKNGSTLNDGTLLSTVLDNIESLDDDELIHGIGVNCCDIQHVQSLTTILANHQLQSKHKRAIIFYPNSGETWDANNESWIEGSGCSNPELFANEMMSSVHSIQSMFRQQNKSPRIIIGGCCRTTPSTMNALRKRVDEHPL